jgi:hypothetical protein
VGAGTVSDSYFAYNLGWFLLQESICKRLLTIDALMSLLYGMSPDKEADKVLKCL